MFLLQDEVLQFLSQNHVNMNPVYVTSKSTQSKRNDKNCQLTIIRARKDEKIIIDEHANDDLFVLVGDNREAFSKVIKSGEMRNVKNVLFVSRCRRGKILKEYCFYTTGTFSGQFILINGSTTIWQFGHNFN